MFTLGVVDSLALTQSPHCSPCLATSVSPLWTWGRGSVMQTEGHTLLCCEQ